MQCIDISYTLDSASRNTKLKPKITAVSPMKIDGGHIGRSHSSMKCYRKYHTFLHLWIKNTFLRYVRLEIAAFLKNVTRKKLIGDVVVFESHFKAKHFELLHSLYCQV
jgi:hypothetical protein